MKQILLFTLFLATALVTKAICLELKSPGTDVTTFQLRMMKDNSIEIMPGYRVITRGCFNNEVKKCVERETDSEDSFCLVCGSKYVYA